MPKCKNCEKDFDVSKEIFSDPDKEFCTECYQAQFGYDL